MKTLKPLPIIILCLGLFTSATLHAQFGFSKPNYEKTSMERAAVEYNCAKDKIKVVRAAKYLGGGLIVLSVCDSLVYYECMGTVCQQRCHYIPKQSDYAGAGETGGNYHKQVIERAAIEFECPADEIKQIKHYDGSGQGSYYLLIKGKEVIYECMGSVCNLKCQ